MYKTNKVKSIPKSWKFLVQRFPSNYNGKGKGRRERGGRGSKGGKKNGRNESLPECWKFSVKEFPSIYEGKGGKEVRKIYLNAGSSL